MIRPPSLYLIRHGETAWSASGQFTGRTDLPLTVEGETQARRLGRRLQGVSFTHRFSSPRERARQTGECVFPGVTAEIDGDLAEWDYGDFEGRVSAEIHREFPDWDLFRDGCPGGETPAEVSARVDRVLERIRSLDGAIVAVFSHGHLGRVLAVRWIGLPIAQAVRFLLGTATVSILDHQHGRAESPVIALWNSGVESLP